ncbi:hypothetical protein ACFO4P_13515 [Epilithonimonas pallida]|uniref:Cthe-2314-like HEPN domain-containing protein n=1 Tax=Epilithonimonas pallida TaxID=373671 RepID=A0ABY1QWR6_9FLAO|nr:hypothetical protein [Epilithonimonas pallida]SMP85865.1 hypothetical protein SAMN05421679_10124 [Epilithonimonas pallida]
MSKKHDIETYSKLAEGAKFYLDESFSYINVCLESELRNLIFGELIEKINPTKDDEELVKKSSEFLSEDVIENLKSNEIEFLTKQTVESFIDAWKKSKIYSQKLNHKFNKQHKITSIEILGHLNNFGFFIETLTNRHLLYLYQSKKINDFCYSRISISKVLERLIFIFKDEISNNKLHLNEISNLFSLRNKTVHYTPDNSMALKPTISELIQIWEQSKKLIEYFEKNEEIDEELFSKSLDAHIQETRKKWL